MSESTQTRRLNEALNPILGEHLFHHVTVYVEAQPWEGYAPRQSNGKLGEGKGYALYPDLFSVTIALRSPRGRRYSYKNSLSRIESMSRAMVERLLASFRPYNPVCTICGSEADSPVHLTAHQCQLESEFVGGQCVRPSDHHEYAEDEGDLVHEHTHTHHHEGADYKHDVRHRHEHEHTGPEIDDHDPENHEAHVNTGDPAETGRK